MPGCVLVAGWCRNGSLGAGAGKGHAGFLREALTEAGAQCTRLEALSGSVEGSAHTMGPA